MNGHNKGPSMESGTSWRRHCWGRARKALLPHLPIEVLRGRLRRAEELGLNYRTYAGIRATTGRDIVAVLFSSNALELRRGHLLIAAKTAQKLERMHAERRGLATAPLRPDEMLLAAPLHASFAAPAAFAPFATQRQLLRSALGKLTAEQTILVGAYEAEAEWCSTARLASYLPSDVFFSG